MATETPPPTRASRWKAPSWPAGSSRGGGNSRRAFRFLGLPVVAVAALFLYNGLQDYFVLPKCDSARAKQTLSEIFKQLNFEPVRYEPIKTVSSTKEEVVCNAVLPLPDGANVVADYTFYWDGSKANMKYSVSKKAAPSNPSP